MTSIRFGNHQIPPPPFEKGFLSGDRELPACYSHFNHLMVFERIIRDDIMEQQLLRDTQQSSVTTHSCLASLINS